MKILTFILKLLFLVYTFKFMWTGAMANHRNCERGGKPEDGVGMGRFFLGIICAIPTLLIIYYIDQAMGGTLLPKQVETDF